MTEFMKFQIKKDKFELLKDSILNPDNYIFEDIGDDWYYVRTKN